MTASEKRNMIKYYLNQGLTKEEAKQRVERIAKEARTLTGEDFEELKKFCDENQKKITFFKIQDGGIKRPIYELSYENGIRTETIYDPSNISSSSPILKMTSSEKRTMIAYLVKEEGFSRKVAERSIQAATDKIRFVEYSEIEEFISNCKEDRKGVTIFNIRKDGIKQIIYELSYDTGIQTEAVHESRNASGFLRVNVDDYLMMIKVRVGRGGKIPSLNWTDW